MNEKHCYCCNCKYWTIPEAVCTNSDSEHCADFTLLYWYCLQWTPYIEKGKAE